MSTTKRGQKSGVGQVVSNGKAPAPSPANAWARPLKTTGPPPGMGAADKSRAPPSSKPATPAAKSYNNSKNPNGAALSNIHRERLLHLSLTLIGQKVVATLTDGAVLEGIFHTFTPFEGLDNDVRNKYVLNAVNVVNPGKDEIKSGSTVILAVDKVTQVYAKNVYLDRPNQNGSGAYTGRAGNNDLITDTQISGAQDAGNRDLVAAGSAWTAGGKQGRAEALAGALGDGRKAVLGKSGDTSGLKGSIGAWDQFKANQELFNVNAKFDENLYTTELDKTQIDERKIAEAERIAREIEGTSSTNIHVAEERGQAIGTDYDEEDRYSGVLTKDGKQRHEDQQPTKDKVAGGAAAPKKVMNYAAAVAKADPGGKVGASVAAGQKLPAPDSDPKPVDATTNFTSEKKTSAPVEAKEEEGLKEERKDAATSHKLAEDSEEQKTGEKGEIPKTDDKKDTKEIPKTSKLNANAKEFTFNPAAKSFTPSFGGGASFVVPQQQQQHMEPPMHMHGQIMQPPHYVHAQMGHSGMIPMMSQQYPGMRYQPQYPGMEQHVVPQMQPPLPQHGDGTSSLGQPPATGIPTPVTQGTPSPAGEGDSSGAPSQDGDSSQPSSVPPQGPQSQQPISMTYGVPPQGAYFAGGALMHPRGPGGYPPQFVGGPQQIPLGPQGAPYGRQMYPMQPGSMPPNMLRAPSGAPYYAGPNGPMPYPPVAYGHGMMDDGDGAFRGRGRGQGRGRGRRGGRGGRGPARGQYINQQQQPFSGGHGSGRSTPQQGVSDQVGSIPLPTEAPAYDGPPGGGNV